MAFSLEFPSAQVQNNVTYFDIDGNQAMDFNDVLRMFEDLATQVGVLP